MLTAPGIEPEIDAEVDAPITTEVDVSQILFPQESSEDCMSDAVATAPAPPKGSLLDAKLKKSSPGRIGAAIFALMAVAGVIYIITKITNDLHTVHPTSIFPFSLATLCWRLFEGERWTRFRIRLCNLRNLPTPQNVGGEARFFPCFSSPCFLLLF